MSILSREPNPRATVTKLNRSIILIILTGLVFVACPKRPPRERAPVPHRRPPLSYPNEVNTPERKAAEGLITQGRQALAEEDVESAEYSFQEAIRIDPSYGPAYYWLARTKYELDEDRKAWDLLDRAELLIGDDSVWLDRIDKLRGALSH